MSQRGEPVKDKPQSGFLSKILDGTPALCFLFIKPPRADTVTLVVIANQYMELASKYAESHDPLCSGRV